MSDEATQKEVKEWYENHEADAAYTGEYVRVATTKDVSCFGPTREEKPFSWRVVEINWQNNTVLLAPPNGDK